MKIACLFKTVMIFFLSTFFAGNGFATSSDVQQVEAVNKTYRMQVPFIENKGNLENKEIRFFANTYGDAGAIYIEKNGIITYNLPCKGNKDVVIKERFTESNMTLIPLEPLSPDVAEMFKEKLNTEKDISNYYRMSWGEIYKGIALEITVFTDSVEKFITVLPEGDPDKIKIALKDTKGLKVEENGKLEIIAALCSVQFKKPFAFQVIGDEQKAVEVSYRVHKGNAYGFKVGNYDKNKPLMIHF